MARMTISQRLLLTVLACMVAVISLLLTSYWTSSSLSLSRLSEQFKPTDRTHIVAVTYASQGSGLARRVGELSLAEIVRFQCFSSQPRLSILKIYQC